MSKKRILLIINSGLLNSGVPKIVSDIVSGLHTKFDFDILCQSKKEEFYDTSLKRMGCNIYYRRRFPSGRLGVFYGLTIWPVKLFYLLLRNKYDCVHSFTAFQSGIDCFVANMCNVKVRVSNTHGTVRQEHSILYGNYQKFCRQLIRKYSTHRVSVSKQAGASLYDADSFTTIYNSVPINHLNSIKKAQHDGINFLQVGYFNENKNQLFSLALLQELINEGLNCKLYFIGFDNGNGYLNRIETNIETNKLTKHVTILPHDYNKDAIYPIIDFMLLPSLREGLSLVALECQAANIKCLVSDAVPEDVNIGLLHRLPLSNMELWVETTKTILPVIEHMSVERAKEFSNEVFLTKFEKIYSNN